MKRRGVYASDHLEKWQDGITPAAGCLIERNAVIDATDVGIVLFRFVPSIPALRPRILSINAQNSSGEMQPGAEDRAMHSYDIAFIIGGGPKEKKNPRELKEAYILETFTDIPVERFYA